MWQAVNHALCKATICLWSTLSNSLSVWMYLFCLLCMYNMSMYICICVLSTVGTGALICCIIVLYLLYWIKNIKKKKKKKKELDHSSLNNTAHRKTNQVKTGQYNKYVSIFTFYTAKVTKPRPVFISRTYQYLHFTWARLRDVSGCQRRKPKTTCAVWIRHRWRNGPNHKLKHMAHSLLRYTVSQGLEPVNFVFSGHWTYSTVGAN